MTTSRVSVVIPARNAGQFLSEALDSVFEQGLRDPEVVVVDDGSADGTAEAAATYGRGVRVVSQPPSGSAKARNLGLASTSGELVAFLDADDVWEPDKTRLQLPLLEADPDLAMVFSDMIAFDETGASRSTYFQQRGYDGRCTLSSIFLYDMISTPTVILRRRCLEEVGPFDERLRIGQDTDLWFRIALRHRFAAVDRPLVRRRFHAGNVTKDSRLLARCVVEVWERYLDRCVEREPAMKRILTRDFARKRWNHLFEEGCSLLREGRAREGRAFLAEAMALAPLRLRAGAFYLASLVRPAGVAELSSDPTGRRGRRWRR